MDLAEIKKLIAELPEGDHFAAVHLHGQRDVYEPLGDVKYLQSLATSHTALLEAAKAASEYFAMMEHKGAVVQQLQAAIKQAEGDG